MLYSRNHPFNRHLSVIYVMLIFIGVWIIDKCHRMMIYESLFLGLTKEKENN